MRGGGGGQVLRGHEKRVEDTKGHQKTEKHMKGCVQKGGERIR